MVQKPVKDIKLLVRATFTGHISKEIWVSQDIADWELYVFMNNLEFTKDLIKGKIAEIIFEQMFRETNKYTILRFGYEYTMPQLAQYQKLLSDDAKKVLENLRHAPDFVLITENKKELYLVEVKYRTKINEKETLNIAQKILEKCELAWLFIASPIGFFFEPCNTIVRNNGVIGILYPSSIKQETQKQYLNLLKEFEQ